MADDTLAGPGFDDEEEEPEPTERCRCLKETATTVKTKVQEIAADEILVHKLAFCLFILGVPSFIAWFRFQVVEAIWSTLASGVLTGFASWLVGRLAGCLAERLEQQELSMELVVQGLAFTWTGVGTLPGVALAPMCRPYVWCTMLMIAMASLVTFVAILREPLCHALPCEQQKPMV
ncbi:unnamed protein product [Effrenium voratum]|nr:unnamed protein product [Effrenium voratum]